MFKLNKTKSLTPYFRLSFLKPVRSEKLLTVTSTRLKVLHGLTERVALPVQTPAVVNTRHVVSSVFRRWTLAAVS